MASGVFAKSGISTGQIHRAAAPGVRAPSGDAKLIIASWQRERLEWQQGWHRARQPPAHGFARLLGLAEIDRIDRGTRRSRPRRC